MGLTAFAALWMEQSSAARSQRRFDTAVGAMQEQIRSRLDSYIALLRGGGALLAVKADATRFDWHDYVERLRIQEFYPGVQGMGFTRRMAPGEIEKVVESIRSQGIRDFQIHPPDPRPEYHTIVFLEPLDRRNLAALGYDMFTEPTRRAAMERAWTSGEAAASGKVRLVQEIDGREQSGFLIYLPVYSGEAVPTTEQERRQSLRGFVYSPFRIDDLFYGIFGRKNPFQLDLEVFDGAGPEPERRLFPSTTTATSPIRARHRTETQIEVGGRAWTLAFSSSPTFHESTLGGLPFAATALGIGLSLALFYFARREAQARAEAEGSAADLAEQREKLQVTLSSIGDAVIATDIAGRVQLMNAVAQTMTGWTQSEALGKPLQEVFHVLDDTTGKPIQSPVEQVLRQGSIGEVANHTLLVSRNGDRRSIDDSAAPIQDRNGNAIGVVVVFHDVTEKRHDERRLKVQHEITQMLSSTNSLEEAIPGVLESFCEKLQWDVGVFWQLDVETQRLVCQHTWQRLDAACKLLPQECKRTSFGTGEELPGRVSSDPRNVSLEDIENARETSWTRQLKDAGVRSAVAIPVVAGEKVFGVLEFFSCTRKTDTRVYLNTKQAIGVQVGQFIERKRAEEALRESEERYRKVIETAADGIITMNEESIIQSVNPAAERLFGRTAEELIGQSMTVLMPERFRSKHREGVHRFLRTKQRGIPWTGVELPGLQKDGTEIPLEISFGFSQQNGRNLFIGFLRDISQRKRAQEALQASQQQLQLITDSLPVLISYIDSDQRYRFNNRAYEDWFGRTQSELQGKHLREVLGEAGYAALLPSIEAGLRGERVHREIEVPLTTGETRLVDASYIPRFDSEGKVEGLYALVADITARRRAEVELRRTQANFKLLFDFNIIGFYFGSSGGEILEANDAFLQLLGYSREELEQGVLRWDRITPPEWHAQDQDFFSKFQASGFFGPREKEYFHKDGHRVPVVIGGARLPEQSRGIIFVLDLTRQKQVENELKEAQRELARHAAELEKKVTERTAHLQEMVGELEGVSYSLSHDMRAPLRTIQSFSEIVLADAKARLEPTEAELLTKSINAARRLDRLIRDVLIYSRVSRESIDLQPIEVENLLRQIIEERPEFQPPAAQVAIERPLGRVQGHEAYLTQCLTNLLDNAVKFVRPNERPRVRIWSEDVGGNIRLWIEDNGIGITPEAQQRVFGIFQRVHSEKAYPGTGIGLAIVRKAVERMGGTVGVESQPGAGSRFWVELRRGH